MYSLNWTLFLRYQKLAYPLTRAMGMSVTKGQIVGVWQEQSFCTVGRDELMLFPSTQVVNRVAEWSLTTNLFSSSEFFFYVLLPPYCSYRLTLLLLCNLRRKSMALSVMHQVFWRLRKKTHEHPWWIWNLSSNMNNTFKFIFLLSDCYFSFDKAKICSLK